MIIQFKIENWRSFQKETSFSMVASSERQYKEQIPVVKKYRNLRILPIAAVYGGNASGKTNFIEALSFLQHIVVRGTKPDSTIPVEPYRLNTQSLKQPSRFNLQLLIDEAIYEFMVVLTRKEILEEKLVKINSNSEVELYHRYKGISFDSSLKDQDFLNFIFKGTRDNQLFLTEAISRKADVFRPVYNWFKHQLMLIEPDSPFLGDFEKFSKKEHKINTILPRLDTGISRLGEEEVSFDNLLLPNDLKIKFQEDIKEGDMRYIRMGSNFLIINNKKGKLVVKRLIAYHYNTEGKEIKFELDKESNGTQRIIDLLPAFLDISTSGSQKVYVIDELDRSLHTLLTKKLLEIYLNNCSNQSRTQLLFTTHDLLLMDQKLLRRDEMWVTERNAQGVSDLFSFSDYKEIRNDKDIRKSYLQGRLGGIPKILLNRFLLDKEPE